MKNTLKILALGVALAASTTLAKADSFTDVGVFNATPNGTLLASTTGTVTEALWTATYTEQVFQNSNLHYDTTCPSCLTFVITVTNSSSSSDDLGEVSLGDSGVVPAGTGFNAYDVDAGYVGGASVPVPTSITETLGGTIDANYGSFIAPGATSVLVFETDATDFTTGNLSIQDDATATVEGYIPSTPEPSSLALLGTGLLGLAGVARRKFASRFSA